MRRMPATVIALGFASFFTDLSSEMIYPLLPIFLVGTLGAGAFALGLIEGVAETVAALLKIVSGRWTDRLRRRKPFIFVGYGLAGIARPLIGLAGSWPMVLLLRGMDRVGKGIRTSPRDALIADSVPVEIRGRAFGFHRMMDHGGAVLGPLVAAVLLSGFGFSLQTVFLCAALPAAVVMAVIVFAVHDAPRAPATRKEPDKSQAHWPLGANYRRLLIAILVFTLGNATDAFILLRLSDAGLSAAWIALLWSAHHVVKMTAAYTGGTLSDRFGRRAMILSGWLLYALVYGAFAFAQSLTALVVIFLVYGVYYGFVEPVEKAWVVDLVPAEQRGTALGYYHGTVGIAALPASLLFGVIWDVFSPGAAFACGAALALVAAGLVTRVAAA